MSYRRIIDSYLFERDLGEDKMIKELIRKMGGRDSIDFNLLSGGRLLLSKEELEALDVLYTTKEVIREAMCDWYYNPVFYYPQNVSIIKNERGHDRKYRYVEKTK